VQKIIDFHTHIFPDQIAVKTIDFLKEKGGIPAYSDGTLSGLKKELEEGQVCACVALPVLTKPQSFDSILRFTKMVNEGYFSGEHNVLSFAGIHPDCEEIEKKMAIIKASGFKGVKIHPDYQQTFIDDSRFIRILNAAIDEDLIVVAHAGFDVGYPDCTHCTPIRTARALDRLKGEVKLVLAHMGGCRMHEEVYQLLAGRNVYFDTSYVLDEMDKALFLKIVEKHGADRVLFASDSPWKQPKTLVKALQAMGLSKEEEEKIFYKNAEKLLGEGIERL
jgi:predicted TIM-barrel fold metal-dependent hydrolase